MENPPATIDNENLNTELNNNHPEVNRIDVEEAFKLRYYNKLTLQAIADKFGVTKAAVFFRLRRFENLIKNGRLCGWFPM